VLEDDVIALVDRLEGGRDAIESAGLRFHAIYTRQDFMSEISVG